MMPRVRSRNAYQYVSDFDKGRIVVYTDCGLSYRRIAARIGRDAMTHQDCRTRVLQYRGERTLAAGIRHLLTGPLPGAMVWVTNGYTPRSSLVRV
ncbi:hypothetical protein TNCV_3878151, partial [Trichonephila clavipes]